MAKSTFFLLIYAAIIVVVRADGLSDFSNNLASDLGPLLSLFGDAVTRQYLSESTTFLDYFIFAMAPIGIIGTITAVIRVCGSSSLRAFIGRAQEGQGTTEAELCTSTSADVCELFNKGGITRVLGRPDIIELVYIPDGGQANRSQQKEQQKEQQQSAPQKLRLFTSYLEDSSNECWQKMTFSGSGNAVFNKIGNSTSGNFLDLAPKPNLSLNVGIRRQPDWVFYVIALVGFILQAGILVFAGTAVWLLEWNLQKPNSEASRNYAPGIFIAGTITYAKGKDRLMMWTSSTKDFDKNFEAVTYFAVSLVLLGYIAQFIGLRGLNAWISIAQLGITIIMSILRGILRMKRLDKNNNRLTMWQDVATGHELDWLAFDIAEQELTKRLKIDVQDASFEKDQSQRFEKKFLWFITGQHEKAIRLENVAVRDSGSETLERSRESDLSNEWLVAYNDELIQNRTRLSNLTGHFGESMDAKSYLSWKDERVRVRAKAKSLSAMISQAAAILLRNQSNKEDIHLRIKVAFSYDKSNGEETIVSIKLKPPTGPDHINWGVDSSQLEAILGLWLWSITRREYDTYSEKKASSDISSLPNKVLNSRVFRVVSVCHGEQEWDSSFDTDMSLWLGSGDLKYIKRSLDLRLYNGYKYSLADHWIPRDDKSVFSGQDTNQTTKEDNESKNYQRVGESSNDSTAGFQRFCGWNLIYDALSTAASEKESNNTSERRRVDVKGFLMKDTEHSLLDICAQELFVALLHSMKALEFRKLDKISVSESSGNLRLENPVISTLAKCFTDNGMGTHSDAISCLIPSLRSEIPPYQEKVLSALTPVASSYRRDGEWSSAEVVLSWACQYHHNLNPADTDESGYFMAALRELGELYRSSLAQMQHRVRQGFSARGIEQMAAKFGPTNPIVAVYSTVAQKIKYRRTESQGWTDEFHQAVMDCRRADALYNLCFAGSFMPHKLSKCLLPAARNGWDEILCPLLEMKPSPNDQDDDGRTLVSHCAESDLRQSLRRLIDMNADLDLADKYKMTPLAYAAMNGRKDVVRLLIETGQVDLKGTGVCVGKIPLWLAIDRNHFGIIMQLLDKGADINMKSYNGRGLLDLAISRGNPGVVKSLLERGLRIEWEHPNIKGAKMEQLLKWGFRIEGPELSKIRVHPLIWAAWRGHTDVIRLLLEDHSVSIPPGDEMREAKKLLERGSILQPLRNHSDGFFSTLDIHPFRSVTVADAHRIEFNPPYVEAPRLMIGINEQEFQEQILVGNFSPSEENPHCEWEEDISFQNAFKQEPKVVVWLRGLSQARQDRQHWDFFFRPAKITTNGFKMEYRYYNEDVGNRFHVAWLAYPADSTHVQSSTFTARHPDLNIIQRQEFAKEIWKDPPSFFSVQWP
ncbi:hypothetical protein Trihar35433_3559 [Trichoderma harzianum]|nr:hypothetical protein Trihar35433_3559 [Trichoderma harzianum]